MKVSARLSIVKHRTFLYNDLTLKMKVSVFLAIVKHWISLDNRLALFANEGVCKAPCLETLHIFLRWRFCAIHTVFPYIRPAVFTVHTVKPFVYNYAMQFSSPKPCPSKKQVSVFNITTSIHFSSHKIKSIKSKAFPTKTQT